MHPILREPSIEAQLQAIETVIAATPSSELPSLFAGLPLTIFAVLLHDLPAEYPNIRARFPAMASVEVQKRWTGASDYTLLGQSCAFVEKLVALQQKHGTRPLGDCTVLDYGVGWGRLLRLLQRHVPEELLYGVDAWDVSLELSRSLGVRGKLAKIDSYPQALPFDARFDLIFSFSVFTHLSEKAMRAGLAALRRSITADGLFVATIRPWDYWNMSKAPEAERLVAQHQSRGFAYAPHGGTPVDGDTSISLSFIEREWTGWRVVASEYGLLDPYQFIVALKPC